MDEWGVALLVILLLAVLAITVGVLVKLFGIGPLASCWNSTEEKAALTQNEKGHGFLTRTVCSDLTLESGSGCLQYDAIQTNPCLADLETFISSTARHRHEDDDEDELQQQQVQQALHDDSTRSSPVSLGTSSIGYAIAFGRNGIVSEVIFLERASDFDLGQGIRRAESCDSVASDSSVLDMQPDLPRIGQLEFSLEYDREASGLIVHVIQCRDLTPALSAEPLETFVRGVLLPGEDENFQTRTIKNTTDPVFKERFLFHLEPEQLLGKSLQLQVYSADRQARQKVIGEVDVRLGDIDLHMPIRMWFNLRDIDEKPTEHGDILFSLSYLPTAERLTVVVVKARSLRWRGGKASGDPFVKVYLLQNGKKISKKKTSVKRGEKNPIFNEAMIFSVPASTLPTVQLRITVAEWQADGRTPSLGHVIVGANTSGTEATHWNQMMTSLRKPVAMWHFLRK